MSSRLPPESESYLSVPDGLESSIAGPGPMISFSLTHSLSGHLWSVKCVPSCVPEGGGSAGVSTGAGLTQEEASVRTPSPPSKAGVTPLGPGCVSQPPRPFILPYLKGLCNTTQRGRGVHVTPVKGVL